MQLLVQKLAEKAKTGLSHLFCNIIYLLACSVLTLFNQYEFYVLTGGWQEAYEVTTTTIIISMLDDFQLLISLIQLDTTSFAIQDC